MADKLTSALVLRRERAAWTSLRERKGRPEVADQVEAPIELPASCSAWNEPEAVAQIKARCGAIKGALSLALPTEAVLLRVVKLPSGDPAELRGMAELQVDKYAPYPLEDLAIGVEILERSNEQSLVLMAAARLTRVEQLGEGCVRAGLNPNELDVEALGWWHLLKAEHAIPAEGRHLLLVLDGLTADLWAVQDGQPILVRALAMSGSGDPAAEIAEELGYTLTALEAEWGPAPVAGMQVWRRDNAPAGLAGALQDALGMPVQEHMLDRLPPLSEGLARRAVLRGEGLLDLAPPGWKAASQDRAMRRVLLAVAGVVLALWLTALLALLAGYQVQRSRLAGVKAEAARLAKPVARVKELQAQLAALEKYGDRSFSGLECLRVVSASLPAGVELTSFSYKKYKEVNLRGEADTSDPIYDFFKQLEQAGLFKAIKPEGVTDEMRGGRRRSQFRATCELPEEEP